MTQSLSALYTHNTALGSLVSEEGIDSRMMNCSLRYNWKYTERKVNNKWLTDYGGKRIIIAIISVNTKIAII